MVVVGAGVSGAFVAYELSKDFTVAVLDRRRPIEGSTLASTAMLQWELDLPLTALGEKIGEADAARVYRRSLAAVDDLAAIVDEARIRCGLRRKSSLYLAGDTYGHRALKREVEARASLGLPSRFIGRADLNAQYGLDRTGAILSAGSASADPAQLTAGLLRRAISRGASVFTPVEVREVLEGVEHVTVVTDAGVELRGRHVVFCCGYEFPKGVPTDGASVLSTWALATHPLAQPPAWLLECLVWEASDPYLYFRMTTDGRIVAGGEDEESASRHAEPDLLEGKARRILGQLRSLAPDLDAEPDYAWAGAFGSSRTSMPLIGPVPRMPRAYAVMGFGGNGITYSVIASQIIGAAIRGQADPDAALYRFPDT